MPKVHAPLSRRKKRTARAIRRQINKKKKTDQLCEQLDVEPVGAAEEAAPTSPDSATPTDQPESPGTPRISVQRPTRTYSHASSNVGHPINDRTMSPMDNDGSPGLNVEMSSERIPSISDILRGRRLVDLGFVLEQYEAIAQHPSRCTLGRMKVVSELRRGLHSNIRFRCDMCNAEEVLRTERPPSGHKEVNQAFVWGALAVGIGHSQAEEFFAILDTPALSAPAFREHEAAIGEVWQTVLSRKMAAAIEEEKALAIARGDVTVDGIPFITVIVDGGWGKRSYGHNYSSKAGVACVIGACTKKLLYLGARNKFCYKCSVAKPGADPSDHACTINFTGSSTGMEQAIIIEGLTHIYREHGLWVKYLIGDGDSSVYARVRERAPMGSLVVKIECANHMTRNYTSKLHTLRLNTKYPLPVRKVLTNVIPRLSAAVRGAIRINAEGGGNAPQLRMDLRNGPRHVFGDHSACNMSYCKRIGLDEPNYVPDLEKCGMMREIDGHVDYIVRHSDRLTLNSTTNLAENFMSLVAKMVGGKRVDFAKGGSYGRRCLAAGLSFLGGPACQLSPLRRSLGRSPGTVTKRILLRRQGNSTARRKLRMESATRKPRRQAIYDSGPDCEYGPNAAKPDLEPAELETKKAEIMQALLAEVATVEKATELERSTVGQHENLLWRTARLQRLTASNFGEIVSMRDTTSVQRIVHKLKTRPEIYSKYTQYGRLMERRAIAAYEKRRGVQVASCGLFVSREYPFLGASPDGLVGDDGLVEVKTFPSLRNKSSILKAAGEKKNLCVRLVDGELKMKPTHHYWYQVQGQIAITGRKYCDLVLFVDHDVSLDGSDKEHHDQPSVEEVHIVRVYPDPQTWQKAIPRLERFYRECFLPELADSRIERGMPVREPSWYVARPTAGDPDVVLE